MQPDEHTPADLWFFANNASHKFEELEADPNVNLAFCKESTSEWISVSGKAKVVNDREKIKQLYKPTIKVCMQTATAKIVLMVLTVRGVIQPWFGDLKDGVHDGGPNDPRVSLIFVEAETVHYSKKDTPTPVQIWNIAKGIITGEPRKVSADRNLDTQELQHAREVNQLEDNVVA